MSINKLDQRSFEVLFRDNYVGLCRYCIQFVKKPEIAEEIVQDQFIIVWEKKDSIDIHTSYKSYLYKSVKNRSIDYLKSRISKLKFEEPTDNIGIAENYNPQIILEAKDTALLVQKAIDDLPEKCHVIFSLSSFAGLSNKEIADELDISIKTVENQVTIAIKKIKVALKNHGILLIVMGALYFKIFFK